MVHEAHLKFFVSFLVFQKRALMHSKIKLPFLPCFVHTKYYLVVVLKQYCIEFWYKSGYERYKG